MPGHNWVKGHIEMTRFQCWGISKDGDNYWWWWCWCWRW